jgi:VanZ family protein
MTARTYFRIIAWLCVITIGVLSIVAPALRPVTFLPHSLEHAAIFAAAGFAATLGYPGRATHQMSAFVLFAAAVELGQIFAPGRHARLTDFVIDALAACAGFALAQALARLRARSAGP